MNDTLPAAYQAIAMEVIYDLAGRVLRATTLEERAGSGATLAHFVRMRDPRVAKVVADVAEKVAKRGKNG